MTRATESADYGFILSAHPLGCFSTMSSHDWIFETQARPPNHTISYGSHPAQFVELRLPSSGALTAPHSKAPWIVVIHGGFWKAENDCAHAGHLCQALTDQLGVVTWNLEYRRVGNGGGVPTTFDDVIAAIQHIQSLASQYYLDLNQCVVMGHSAGGQLASWLGSAVAKDRLKIQPKAVVSLAGALDFEEMTNPKSRGFFPRAQEAVYDFVGGDPQSYPDRYAFASPIRCAIPSYVPQILIHGDQDPAISISISEKFAAQSGQKNSPVKFYPLAGADHFDGIDPRSKYWEGVKQIVREALF